MPTTNLLLDTCVLIDFLGRKPPFYSDAESLMAAGYFGDVKLWAPVQSLKDAFYVLSKYVDSAMVQSRLVKLSEVVTFVDLSATDALRAARLGWNDYEDCLIAQAAAKVGADYLVTRDACGFNRSFVPAVSPKEWLDEWKTNKGISYCSTDF